MTHSIKKTGKITYVFVLYFLSIFWASATHIKAGEFSATRLSASSLQYAITLTLYYNTLNTQVDPSTVVINFGDGSSATVARNPKINIGNNTTRNVFQVNHTYNGAGTYIVNMRDQNRNSNIWNIPNSSSVAFYVEMQIQVNPLIGIDNSPIMTVPPIDYGNVDRIFTHNPGAYDPDGDSLSYTLIPCQSDFNTQIVGYNYPSAALFGGQSTLGGPAFETLNPTTGEFTWNSPSDYGTPPRFYNICIRITEWRYGIAIGYVERDMQIEILETTDNPPVLVIPPDTCVEAGNMINATFYATDPDGDDVLLQYFGQPFDSLANRATATVTGQLTQKPVGTFNWQTNCLDVRSQPYQVIFKASDNLTQPLVNVETWLIYIKGPKVTGITATPGSNFMTLNWSLYSCSGKASVINVYRRDCDSVAPAGACTTGPLSGYTLIGSVKPNVTTFVDNNNGKGLNKGKSYCYMLVAEYPAPGYGESYPSDQICAELNQDVPVFSSILVQNTSLTNGQIFLNWYPPLSTLVTGPYNYMLQRGTGTNPTVFTNVASITDTFYTDTNLDTKNILYSYQILLVNNGLYSSVIPMGDLNAVAGNASVSLSWIYGTPWTTDSVQIYRKINSGSFIEIKSFAGNTVTSYTDKTVANCDTVYYYIQQYGYYCDKNLTNIATQSSAIDSVRPLNTNPPPAPALTVKGCNGDTAVYKDLLNWTSLTDLKCNTIDHYNIYFAPNTSSSLNVLLKTNDTSYSYLNHNTTAGCFAVSATNVSGVEGALSQTVCVDDCPFYELPNLITVNGDGKNDQMEPFPYPRGVQHVNFYVYNRWGDLVYFNDQDININWNGSSNGGQVSDGIYYFLAEVTYYGRENEKDNLRKIKGWVQVITGGR
jgi:gliding motility-associated-like protein